MDPDWIHRIFGYVFIWMYYIMDLDCKRIDARSNIACTQELTAIVKAMRKKVRNVVLFFNGYFVKLHSFCLIHNLLFTIEHYHN